MDQPDVVKLCMRFGASASQEADRQRILLAIPGYQSHDQIFPGDQDQRLEAMFVVTVTRDKAAEALKFLSSLTTDVALAELAPVRHTCRR